MKSVLRYSLLGLLAFAAFMVLLAPARLVTDRVSAQVSGFSVRETSGTVISGIAQEVDWQGTRIAKLSWNWQPSALLSGWLKFGFKADDPELTLTGIAAVSSNRHLHFQAVKGHLSLGKIMDLAGRKFPAQGMIEADLHKVQLNPTGQLASAKGQIQVLNLRSTLGQALELGSFTLQISPMQPKGIQGLISDNNAPLILNGILKLLPDGRYDFDGEAAVRDPSNRSLQQALQFLGSPNAQGRWVLKFSGIFSW